jgi:glycosyltransferase involved in cell wall biosynthesis
MLSSDSREIKIAFIVNYIPHYRLDFFQILGKFYELTVLHTGQKSLGKLNFREIVVKKRFFLNFSIYSLNVNKFCRKYDVVITLADLKVLQCMLMGFNPFRNWKLIYWGIGVSASYDKNFDQDRRFDYIRFYLLNKADALVFYSDYPIKKYLKFGCSKEKLFVANNTVCVKKRIEIKQYKKYLLFVGTLYSQKGIFDILEAYKTLHMNEEFLPELVIVGDGPEWLRIKDWISTMNFREKIILKGEITDSEELGKIYSEAIVCISPKQAGLSVLASMAHGVPFLTSRDAITGGEIFNIVDGENGFLYDGSFVGLIDKINYIINNLDAVYKISKNAQEYYFQKRNIELMVAGFRDAVKYVCK